MKETTSIKVRKELNVFANVKAIDDLDTIHEIFRGQNRKETV